MNIRGKFVVQSVKRWPGTVAEAILSARSECTIPEDKQYTEGHPSGNITLTLTRTAVADALVPGSVWYVDLTPAPAGIDEMDN